MSNKTTQNCMKKTVFDLLEHKLKKFKTQNTKNNQKLKCSSATFFLFSPKWWKIGVLKHAFLHLLCVCGLYEYNINNTWNASGLFSTKHILIVFSSLLFWQPFYYYILLLLLLFVYVYYCFFSALHYCMWWFLMCEIQRKTANWARAR